MKEAAQVENIERPYQPLILTLRSLPLSTEGKGIRNRYLHFIVKHVETERQCLESYGHTQQQVLSFHKTVLKNSQLLS